MNFLMKTDFPTAHTRCNFDIVSRIISYKMNFDPQNKLFSVEILLKKKKCEIMLFLFA